MKTIKNLKIGDFTLKDMLEDIRTEAKYKMDYKGDRDAMIKKINKYLDLIK